MDNVDVSVIIPSKDGNRDGNVERLVDQLRNQTLPPNEIILAIGYSPNGRARNQGVEKATGEVLAFFDDDAVLGHERVLENLTRPLLDDDSIGLTGLSMLLPRHATHFQRKCAAVLPRLTFPVQSELVDSDMVCHLGLAIKASLFREIGGESDFLISGTDPDLRHRVRQAGYRVCVVPDTWAYHPQPETLWEMMRMNYVNAQKSAWVESEHPDLVFELDAGFQANFKPKVGAFTKISRLLGRCLLVLKGDVITPLMAGSRAAGYLVYKLKTARGGGDLASTHRDQPNARVIRERRHDPTHSPIAELHAHSMRVELRHDETLSPERVNSVLACRLGGIGDAVLITPSVRALRERFPKARIDVVCEEVPALIFANSTWPDELITDTKLFRCQKYLLFLTPPYLIRLWRLWRKFRSRRYDLYVEFHSLYNISSIFKPLLISVFSGAAVRAGLNTYGRGFFLTNKTPDNRSEEKHHLYRYQEVLASVGVPCENLHTEVVLCEEDVARAKAIFQQYGVEETKPVTAIFLGANPGEPIKHYFPERFADIANLIAERHGHQVLVFSGPDERELIDQFEERRVDAKAVKVLTESHPLLVTAAMIAACDYFISADTGIMHLGIAVDTPTLGIFGSGDWHTYGTYPSNFRMMTIRADVPCSPCRNFKCRHRDCMRKITPEMVMERFEDLMGKYLMGSNEKSEIHSQRRRSEQSLTSRLRRDAAAGDQFQIVTKPQGVDDCSRQ